MPCRTTDKPAHQLIKDGFEYLFSFHAHILEQWNMACEKARDATSGGLWDVVMVFGQNEIEKKDGVRYLYRKKTGKLLDLEEAHKP